MFHFQFLSSKYLLCSASNILCSNRHEFHQWQINDEIHRCSFSLYIRTGRQDLIYFSQSGLNSTINSRLVYVPVNITVFTSVYQGLIDVCWAFESVSTVWPSGEVLLIGRRTIKCSSHTSQIFTLLSASDQLNTSGCHPALIATWYWVCLDWFELQRWS